LKALPKSACLLLPDFQRLRQFEANCGLGRQHNVFIPSESRAAGTGASAGRHSNRGTLTSASEGSDDSAQSCASARHDGRALSFTLR
jgi:hypothetical protein